MKNIDHTNSKCDNSSGLYKGSTSNNISTVSSCERKDGKLNIQPDFQNLDGGIKNTKDDKCINASESVLQYTKPIQSQYDTARSYIPREKLTRKKSSVVYRCRKCRSILASDDNILCHHNTGKNTIETGNFISN